MSTGLTQDSLGARCQDFAEAAAKGADWIQSAPETTVTGGERTALIRNLRRAARRGSKLGAAATSNMAVSVFGPSQNGKSFLISVLARPEGRTLYTAFDDPDGELSYIRDINPEGEGESTGLVTRFTMTRPKTPAGYPVPLRMLSLADIAQTLVNSFFMDGDRSEPEPDARMVEEHIARFSGRKGAGTGGITADDIHEIAHYIERNFRGYAYAAGLRPFWDEAADLAPQLGLADLGDFLSLLWGGYSEFTSLFDTLAKGLSDLGFAAETFAPLASLIPRETSIIDVAQLHRIGKPGADTLELALPDGGKAVLPRPVICALTAEFVLPMRDLPDEMFRQTDLLDFPGTRNRFSKPLPVTFVDPDGGLGQLILRGKVAYLFDRYVEDQKINAMLLCIKNSNMESIDLPRLVENWVNLTQGASPERRAQSTCILFFCLTFFDTHLIDSAAGAGEMTRFEKRLYQSIIEKFGSSNWVRNWTPGKQFNNTFWIRNPNYPVEALFEYDPSTDPPTETLKPEKASRMAELREGCLTAQLVQDHFADPAAAWDAAMTENDGGVTYLKRHLLPVCSIPRKLEQIDGQILALEEEVLAGIGRYYVSDDLDERRREKQAAADRLIEGLTRSLQERSFGALLGAMMVDQDRLFDLMTRVPANIRISNASAGADRAANPAALIAGLRGRASNGRAPGTPAPASPAGVRTLTRAAFQAEVAMQSWRGRLERLKDDPRLDSDFGLSPELATSLAGEMMHASRRANLESDICRELEVTGFGLTLDSQARPASILACERINRFVTTLGYGAVDPSSRPEVPDAESGPVPIFADRPVRDKILDLPEQPRATLPEFWRDWIYALDAMFTANASQVSGANVDEERNAALGRVIRKLGRGDGAAA